MWETTETDFVKIQKLNSFWFAWKCQNKIVAKTRWKIILEKSQNWTTNDYDKLIFIWSDVFLLIFIMFGQWHHCVRCARITRHRTKKRVTQNQRLNDSKIDEQSKLNETTMKKKTKLSRKEKKKYINQWNELSIETDWFSWFDVTFVFFSFGLIVVRRLFYSQFFCIRLRAIHSIEKMSIAHIKNGDARQSNFLVTCRSTSLWIVLFSSLFSDVNIRSSGSCACSSTKRPNANEKTYNLPEDV